MERVRVSSSGRSHRCGVASFPHTLERQAQTPRLKTLHPPVPVRTHLPPARSRRPPTTSTTTHARATYRVASRPRTRGARPRQSSRPRRTRSRHTSTSSNDENENAQPPMEVHHARATQRPHERSPSIMPQAHQPSPSLRPHSKPAQILMMMFCCGSTQDQGCASSRRSEVPVEVRAKPARQGGGDGKGEGFIFRTQPQTRLGRHFQWF